MPFPSHSTLALLALGRSLVTSASCIGSECDANEDASLLAFHRAPKKVLADSGARQIQCPGSQEAFCSGDTCCPGVAASGGKTFPCPSAARDFTCEGGHEELAAALLGAMSREEKYKFLRGEGWVENSWDLKRGWYIGNAAVGLYDRYGIPSLNMEDNGNGFRTASPEIIGQVTSWPVALALSATWSEEDTERFAAAVAKEFRAKGANVILGPGVNLARVARGGRNAEYISGESPYLGSRLVKPWVRGVQSNKVLAVMKHFSNNNQEDHRGSVNAIVDQRTLHESYYPPFQAAIEAGVAAAMCGYNLVNGVYACGNGDTLVDDLKGKLGFKGWVQSDWWALHDFAAGDGVDQEMPGDATPHTSQYFTDDKMDTLSTAKVNDMVRPQLLMMLKYGLFESEGQTCQVGDCEHQLLEVNATSAEHQALSLELATKAVMLLKNDNQVLPLQKHIKTIAVLGSACDAKQDVEAQNRQWDLGSYYNIGGSGRVLARHPVTILAGLTEACSRRGCQIVSDTSDNTSQALAKAKGADVAIICGGTSSTEGHDRASLSLDQESFLVDVAAALTAIPVVSLTMTPASAIMPWAEDVDAMVNLFFAGQFTGTAFASAVFGESNPSAKTPVTFPLREEDMIPPCPADRCPYSEGLLVGFPALEDKPVLFPFGHGLSYTSFEYEILDVTKGQGPEKCSGAVACFGARVKNTGNTFAGAEVAQLYLGFPEGLGEPKKLLRGFARTAELRPGSSADVFFPLFERDVQVYSPEEGGWRTPQGRFNVHIGASSRDTRLTTTFEM